MYTMIPFRRAMNSMMPPMFEDGFMRDFFDDNGHKPMPRMHVDIKDAGDRFVLKADMPGVEKDAINLNVENDVLTISADVNAETKEEREGYVCRERRSGHMERSFSLEGINASAITADYTNGVLTLNLPKVVEEKKNSFRIAIGGETQPAETNE